MTETGNHRFKAIDPDGDLTCRFCGEGRGSLPHITAAGEHARERVRAFLYSWDRGRSVAQTTPPTRILDYSDLVDLMEWVDLLTAQHGVRDAAAKEQ